MSETYDRLWAVVLAAGEGTRLAALTRSLYGAPVPKQFAPLLGERTMLQLTIERIAPLVPADRIVVVVDQTQESLARAQLQSYPGVLIVLQPGNRGTGPGVLLPLAHVRTIDPDARVVILPADHHVQWPGVFLDAVRRAVAVTREEPERIALVGAVAHEPATDLGWIVPRKVNGTTTPPALPVERFVEKPPVAVARALLKDGGHWNTMVVAAHVDALWRLLRDCLPEQTGAIERYAARMDQADARTMLTDAYRLMTAADLSKAVLENAQGLSMVPMVNAGWSDCGTPKRLLDCLRGTPAYTTLRARLRKATPATGAGASPRVAADPAQDVVARRLRN
jgi:mannose-1-phosphate guanylyltransferase